MANTDVYINACDAHGSLMGFIAGANGTMGSQHRKFVSIANGYVYVIYNSHT